MSKLCTLFSGSAGNCTYIAGGRDGILIDAGVSCKQILSALESYAIEPDQIKAILITHSHTDHIKGLRVLLTRLRVPVYASRETLGALLLQNTFQPGDRYYDIEETGSLPFEMDVRFFRTSHDCAGSGGYTVTLKDGQRVAVCTDLGVVSDEIRGAIRGCKAVVIESNHDVGMLQNGSYPFATKQRILSDCGHLSNVSCAGELPGLIESGATHIVLAHLSRENNTPELARVTAESVLMEQGMKCGVDYALTVAPKRDGKMLYI